MQPQDLPLESIENRGKGSRESLLRNACVQGMTLEELQDLYIEEVLEQHGGNKVHAAAALGIDRKTLYRRAERKAKRAIAARPQSHIQEEASA
jgi:transcriptional regulator with PAS, ATPase and Fis domain